MEWQLRSDLFASGSTRTWAAVNGNYHFTMCDNEAQRLGLLSDRIQRMYEYQSCASAWAWQQPARTGVHNRPGFTAPGQILLF